MDSSRPRLMMSRATEAPRSRSRRASDSAAVFSGVKSMMKKSGPGSSTGICWFSMMARARAMQHDLAAEQRRQGEQRLGHVWRRGHLTHQPLERGGVFARERLAQRLAARGVGRRLVEQTAEKIRMAEVDLEALQPERAQAFDGHRDDLDLGLRLLEPDQLDAAR